MTSFSYQTNIDSSFQGKVFNMPRRGNIAFCSCLLNIRMRKKIKDIDVRRLLYHGAEGIQFIIMFIIERQTHTSTQKTKIAKQ